MPTLVTYDITSKHREVKETLKSDKYGYKDQIQGEKNCKIIYFPNTTLYHATKTPLQAREEVQAVCKALGVTLERCVATPWGPGWAAICGEDF
jgi:hypothetical protein